MNPEQPSQNPYDFIMSSPQKSAPKTFLPGGGSKGMRIALIGGLFGVILIVVLVVMSLFSKPNPNTTSMTGLAETQQEVQRVATAGDQQTTNQGLKNVSITVQMSLLTHQNKTITYLGAQKIKLTLKQLALKQSSTTDNQLKLATQNSTYDVVYTQVLQHELQGYASELKTAYGKVTGTNAKTLLKQEYGDAQKLIAQLAANAPANVDTSAAP